MLVSGRAETSTCRSPHSAAGVWEATAVSNAWVELHPNQAAASPTGTTVTTPGRVNQGRHTAGVATCLIVTPLW